MEIQRKLEQPSNEKATSMMREYLTIFHDIIVSDKNKESIFINEILLDIDDDKIIFVVNKSAIAIFKKEEDVVYFSVRGLKGTYKLEDADSIILFNEIVEKVEEIEREHEEEKSFGGEPRDFSDLLNKIGGADPFVKMMLGAIIRSHGRQN